MDSLNKINDCICPICRIDISNNKFSDEEVKNNSTFFTVSKIMNYQKVLIFYFDVETFEDLELDYKFSHIQLDIIKLIKNSFSVENSLYELIGMINI